MQLELIVAVSALHNGIGFKNRIPWKLPTDMKRFKKLSLNSAVVMGRNTWNSLPVKPLSSRFNVIITSRPLNIPEEHSDSTMVCPSWTIAHENLQLMGARRVVIIGGEQLYKETISQCSQLHITRVYTDHECDRYFTEIPDTFKLVDEQLVKSENGILFNFETWTKKHEENQYLDLCKFVLERGITRPDRTGTGTLSVFGRTMRFDLKNNKFPLLTTKRVFWRGVVEELLWFIRGNTNANDLAQKNVRIWDGNSTREFLNSRGLNHRQVGDLGPVYGFQWRHFGAEYKDMNTDYKNKGIDQLCDVIKKIQTEPESRRLVISAWNPTQLDEMALPPCHILMQFYVANGELSCQMYQRSCDLGLGVPFNIASYALLTRMIAHVSGLTAGDFVYVLGDAHVYNNHIEALQTQLERTPREFPKLYLQTSTSSIDDITAEDIVLENYNPYKTINMKMAV